MKLAEVAQKLGCRLEGEPEIEIRSVAGIEYAESGQLTFLANRRYFPLLKTTRASAVLIEESVAVEREAGLPALATLRSPNPYLAFAHAIELFYQPLRYAPGIHPTAVIAKSASSGEGSHIGPYCFIDEEATIGRNAGLHSFVTIYRRSHIGCSCFAHSHACVGDTKVWHGRILSGQAGSARPLTVGRRAVIQSRSGIPGDVPPGAIYSGYPAVENKLWLKISAALSRLPDMVKRVRELEAELKELKTR